MASITSPQIVELLRAAFPEAEINVQGEGSKFDVRIVDASFEGKRLVARQQAVYAPLNAEIASGAIHAVNIRALTPEEGRKASLFGG